MNTNVQIVRLTTAILGSTAICFFVVIYCSLSLAFFSSEHPGIALTNGAHFMLTWKWFGLAFPSIATAAGYWLIRRPVKQPVLFELLVGGTWLLSLVWLGVCVLSWMVNSAAYYLH
jgi:hypothetical protein